MYVQIGKSDRAEKKYKAVFYNEERKKLITIHFGQRGANDYTITHDDEARERYVERHKDREDWSNPVSAGALSYYLLWTEKSMAKAFNKYLQKFNLKKY